MLKSFSDELYHYGILGMKWGVKRTPEELGHQPQKKRRTKDQIQRDDREKALENIRSLSDEELSNRIVRLEKEKRFRQLTKEDLGIGQSEVQKILISAGKKTASTVIPGTMLYAINLAIRKGIPVTGKLKGVPEKIVKIIQALSDNELKEFAGYAAPKPKNK